MDPEQLMLYKPNTCNAYQPLYLRMNILPYYNLHRNSLVKRVQGSLSLSERVHCRVLSPRAYQAGLIMLEVAARFSANWLALAFAIAQVPISQSRAGSSPCDQAYNISYPSEAALQPLTGPRTKHFIPYTLRWDYLAVL